MVLNAKNVGGQCSSLTLLAVFDSFFFLFFFFYKYYVDQEKVSILSENLGSLDILVNPRFRFVLALPPNCGLQIILNP